MLTCSPCPDAVQQISRRTVRASFRQGHAVNMMSTAPCSGSGAEQAAPDPAVYTEGKYQWTPTTTRSTAQGAGGVQGHTNANLTDERRGSGQDASFCAVLLTSRRRLQRGRVPRAAVRRYRNLEYQWTRSARPTARHMADKNNPEDPELYPKTTHQGQPRPESCPGCGRTRTSRSCGAMVPAFRT